MVTTKRKSKYADNALPKAPSLTAKTPRQDEYIKALRKYPQVIVTGVAGTGKTYIASVHAASQYIKGGVNKIVLTRPNVASGRSLGHFPGTLEEKMAPWTIPFTDVIKEVLGKDVYDCAMKNGNIDIVPFEVMRGRTFKDAIVILDEAQNCSLHELKMFLTRIGDGSQVVLNGDIKQSDLRAESGLKTLLNIIKKQDIPVPTIEFTVEDIVRSDICALWVKAFDAEGL